MKQSVLSKYKYELTLFFLLIFQLIIHMKLPERFDAWFCTTFTLNYKYGFNSRMLVGSILSLFTDYITNKQLMIFNLFFIVLMIVFSVILISSVLKKYDVESQHLLATLFFFLLCAPLSLSYVFQYAYLIDTYSILFFLLALTVEDNKFLKWMLPAICFLGIATHQTFICFYVPIIGIILLHKCYMKKEKTSGIILLLLVCIVSVSAFIYFQFFKHPLPFATSEEAFNYLSKKAQFEIVKEMLDSEYYLDNMANFTIYGSKDVGVRLLAQLFLTVFNSGFIIFFTTVWIKSIKNSRDKFMKFLYFLCMISPIVTIIAFVFAIDWGRWNAQIFISQCAILSYWLYHQKEEIRSSVFGILYFFKANKSLLIILFVTTSFVFLINNNAFGSISDAIRSILPS